MLKIASLNDTEIADDAKVYEADEVVEEARLPLQVQKVVGFHGYDEDAENADFEVAEDVEDVQKVLRMPIFLRKLKLLRMMMFLC